MSLFHVKEKWSVDIGMNEEFHDGSLCVDCFESNEIRIVVGSLQGVLRIFDPRQRNFRVEDQLLVVDLGDPILQLDSGYFSSHNTKSLAVLHPNSLALFTLRETPDGMLCTPLYTQDLPHSSANMLCGNLGNKRGISSICVQSLDGELTLFEGDTVSSVRVFTEHLVAGPLLYSSEIDALVTSTSAFEVVAYSYASLKTHKEAQTLDALWRTVTGEFVFCISEVYRKESQLGHGSQSTAIVVLGERSFFFISTDGAILAQKRLDVEPLAMQSYTLPSTAPPPRQSNILITTHSKDLLVFNWSKLMWAAKSETAPVAVRVTRVQNVDGIIVTLSEAGHLSSCFLGTYPNTTLPFISEESTVMTEDIACQYKALKQALQKDRLLEESDYASAPIKFRVELQNTDLPLDSAKDRSGSVLQPSLGILFYALCTDVKPLLDCDFLFVPPPSLSIDEGSWTVSTIDPGESNEVAIPLHFTPVSSFFNANRHCSVIVSYRNQNGIRQVSKYQIDLPFTFFYKTVTPVKEARFKFVLETNQSAISLKDLFIDVLDWNEFHHALESTVLTFETFNGIRVTIVVSKAAGRYRIQSDCFEAVSVVISELENRLRLHHAQIDAEQGCSTLTITIKDELPLDVYFQSIDDHFECRQKVLAIEKYVENLSVQYRATQKCLIKKCKDAKPENMDALNLVLQKTIEKMLQQCSEIENARCDLYLSSMKLKQTTELILLLFCLRTHLKPEETEALNNVFLHDTVLELETGWEEYTLASVNYALSLLVDDPSFNRRLMGDFRSMKDTSTLKTLVRELFQRIEEQGSFDLRTSLSNSLSKEKHKSTKRSVKRS